MWQTRVLDAADIYDNGSAGLYVEFADDTVSGVLRRNTPSGGRQARVRLPIPERHADAVREAKKLGRRVQITYSRAFG